MTLDTNQDPVYWKNLLHGCAGACGFDSIGWTSDLTTADHSFFASWIASGMHGDMRYLEKHLQARAHPASILPSVQTVVMVLMSYKPDTLPGDIAPATTQGRVARYARGPDYHEVLWERLDTLGNQLRQKHPEITWRAVADTAPLLERTFAQKTGLGWIGKNTMLISRKHGSFTVLGSLLLSHALPKAPNQPVIPVSCGTCTRCIEACPTKALGPPGTLDARKCISYWTIEKRGPIAIPEGENLNGWIFGCDICQEVCPWNRKAPNGNFLGQNNDLSTLDCCKILQMSDDEIRSLIRGTALRRTKPEGLRRNALWILGTQGGQDQLPAIKLHLDSPCLAIQEAAQWAFESIRTRLGLINDFHPGILPATETQ